MNNAEQPQIIAINSRAFPWLPQQISTVAKEIKPDDKGSYWEQYALAIRAQWLQALTDFVENKTSISKLAVATVTLGKDIADERINEDQEIAQLDSTGLSNTLVGIRDTAKLLQDTPAAQKLLVEKAILAGVSTGDETKRTAGKIVVGHIMEEIKDLASFTQHYANEQVTIKENTPTPSQPLSYAQMKDLQGRFMGAVNARRDNLGLS